jgi:hypothetical protein
VRLNFIEPDIYVYTITELDPATGTPKTREIPAFTCGHCTTIVGVRFDRVRPRTRCMYCRKLLCEVNELCMAGCTPLHSMAKDRFETKGPWTQFLDPIMKGATTLEEAQAGGLNG